MKSAIRMFAVLTLLAALSACGGGGGSGGSTSSGGNTGTVAGLAVPSQVPVVTPKN